MPHLSSLVFGPRIDMQEARRQWLAVLDADPAAAVPEHERPPQVTAAIRAADALRAYSSTHIRVALGAVTVLGFLLPVCAFAALEAPFSTWWGVVLLGNLAWLVASWQTRLRHAFPLPPLALDAADTSQPWGPLLMERSLRGAGLVFLLSSLIHLMRLTAAWTGIVLLGALLSGA